MGIKKSIVDFVWGLAGIGFGIYFVIGWRVIYSQIAKGAVQYGKPQEIAVHICSTIIGIGAIIGGCILIYKFFK